MTILEWTTITANLVTTVGLPLALFTIIRELRSERESHDQEAHQMLSDSYEEFLKLVLENSDLQLRTQKSTPNLSPEQSDRMMTIFDWLITLFERAYITVYEEQMSEKQKRVWHSWEDFMREWCRREDFRKALPQLLQGEDPEFRDYLLKIAGEEVAGLPKPAGIVDSSPLTGN